MAKSTGYGISTTQKSQRTLCPHQILNIIQSPATNHSIKHKPRPSYPHSKQHPKPLDHPIPTTNHTTIILNTTHRNKQKIFKEESSNLIDTVHKAIPSNSVLGLESYPTSTAKTATTGTLVGLGQMICHPSTFNLSPHWLVWMQREKQSDSFMAYHGDEYS